MGDRLAQGWEKAKASVPTEENLEATTETTEEPAAAATEVTEAPAAATTEQTEEEKTAAAAEAPAEETSQFTLDDDGEAASPKAFADFLKEHPEASEALDASPELKNKVFAALRRDTENREIRQYVPDVETAKMVTQAASTFQAIDNRFLEATTPEGAQEFLNHWVREAMILDDQGKPVMEDGKYKLHPALTYTFDHIFKNKLSVLADQAKKSGDERLQTALEIINGVTSPSSSASDEFPDELKPYAESLKAKEDALNKRESDAARQQRESQATAHLQSIDRAEDTAAKSVRSQLEPLFTKAGLTDFEKTAALREIGDQIDVVFGHKEADGSWSSRTNENALFQSIYDSILQQPPSEAREKRLIRHIATFTNEHLGKISAGVIRQAKGGALSRQAARTTKVDAQATASKSDPRGTSITPSSQQQLSPKQMREQVVKDLTAANGGTEPDAQAVMAEMFKRVNQPARK